jgi:hypothetical protein
VIQASILDRSWISGFLPSLPLMLQSLKPIGQASFIPRIDFFRG